MVKVDKKKVNQYSCYCPPVSLILYLVTLISIILFVTAPNFPDKVYFGLLCPVLLGVLYFLIWLPFKMFNYFIIRIWVFLKLRNIKINSICETVVITGETNWFDLRLWRAPNFGLDFILLINLLKLTEKHFSVWEIKSIAEFDKIMSNPIIKKIYLVGHGTRHSFTLNHSLFVDYCRYSDKKFLKDEIYQLHCNSGGGKSLTEIATKNVAPEHGLTNDRLICDYLVDKTIKINGYSRADALIFKVVTFCKSFFLLVGPLFIWFGVLGIIFIFFGGITW